MSLVNDYKIPRDEGDIGVFGSGKLVGTKNDLGAVKWIEISQLDLLIKTLGLKNR